MSLNAFRKLLVSDLDVDSCSDFTKQFPPEIASVVTYFHLLEQGIDNSLPDIKTKLDNLKNLTTSALLSRFYHQDFTRSLSAKFWAYENELRWVLREAHQLNYLGYTVSVHSSYTPQAMSIQFEYEARNGRIYNWYLVIEVKEELVQEPTPKPASAWEIRRERIKQWFSK